jgi:hypothetical protein
LNIAKGGQAFSPFAAVLKRGQYPVRIKPIDQSGKLVEARWTPLSRAKPKDFLPDPPVCHDPSKPGSAN